MKLILRLDELLHVFSDEIGFNVDFITNPTGAQISVLQSEWDYRYRKPFAIAIVDG
jgi:hypothetical protein